jgi:hypothetical protein
MNEVIMKDPQLVIDNLQYRNKQLEKVLYEIGDMIKKTSLSKLEERSLIYTLQKAIFIKE